VAIRLVSEADFTTCIDIAHRTWPDFLEREAIYHILCKYFNTTCVVSEDNGTILAFLLGFISQVDAREAYIHLIVTDSAAQRRGIASSLYMEFFKTVRQLGATRVRLTVDPANAASLGFHIRLGFRPDIIGERIQVGNVWAAKDFNGPGRHMVPFLLELSKEEGKCGGI
jgi:ribosomal protein S18 acetylase RimI-like enzyme